MAAEASGKTCSFVVCQECQVSCCRDARPPLTEERTKKIEDYLKKNGILIAQPFEKRGYAYPAVDKFGFCVFYDKKTKRCQVHDVKPETCVAGPVTFDISCQTGVVEWFLKTAAICAFAGNLYPNRKKLAAHFEIARNQILTLINQLDAESLSSILRIEEPNTFKIGEERLPNDIAKKLSSK